MKKTQQEQIYHSLLDDDRFFQWLIHPTKELDEYWKKIMQEDPDKKKIIDDLRPIIKGIRIADNELSSEDKKNIWLEVEKYESKMQRKTPFRILFLRYVAVITLVISVSLSIFLYKNKQTENTPINYESLISKTEETSDNVLIVLGDDEKIELKEKNVELVHDAEGRMIVNAETIEAKKNTKNEKTQFNQLFVPYGKTTSIVMSDGSKLWVNSGSRVIYPAAFEANKREIFVEGEIYLEVARNEKTPFIVKTDLLEINVLGTSFNISAYKSDADQSVVLATGSVCIRELNKKETTTIKPNQKYSYEKSSNTSSLETVDVMNYISWKYGFLIFDRANLSNILRKIERHYNIPLHYNVEGTNYKTISGKLDLKENIEETFRIISIAAPIEYEIGNDQIKISVKP